MTFVRTAAALAALVAASAAQAFSLPTAAGEGALGTNPSTSISANISPVDSVASYSFSLLSTTPSVFSLALTFGGFGTLDLSSVSLAKAGGATTSFAPTSITGGFSGLSAGSYTLTYNFTSSSAGLFVGSVATSTSPVPEADASLLALAGLGVVGGMALRRRKQA